MSLAEQYANNAQTTLSGNGGSITSSATSMIVASASAFPTTGQFRVIVDSEIMLVTAVSGTTFTITRAQEGTSAASHNDGANVTQILTRDAMKRLPTRGRAYSYASGNFYY
jgi:hypothetical protein